MLKVGLVGWGAIGNVHGRVYKALPQTKVVAVADVEPDRRARAAEFLDAQPYESAEDLIQNADVDLIDLCIPTYLHAKYTVVALEKGRHVICEKPMALTVDECTAMIKAQKRSGKVLMIAHCVRFWTEYVYLKKLVDEKTFGELQVLSMTRTGPLTTRSWRNWMLDPKLSGSQTVDRHIHDTDFIIHMLGLPKSVRATGFVDKWGLSHVSTHYIFPGGPAVFAEGGGNIPQGYKFHMAYRAVFDKAAVEFNRHNTPSVMVYPWDGEPYAPKLETFYDVEVASEETGLNITSLGAYYNEIRYLVECLMKGEEPTIVKPEEARVSLAVALAEVESALSGKEVSLEHLADLDG